MAFIGFAAAREIVAVPTRAVILPAHDIPNCIVRLMHRRVFAGVATLLLCTLTATSQAPAPSTSPAAASSDDVLSAPLPDIQTLLTRVRARYDALESLRKNYICVMTQVADEFSSDGSKKTHTDQYQAFYVGSTLVLQHTARDGKPLSSDDAKKEQERVDKLVAKLKSHENKPPKDEVHLSASGLLKIATFTNPRREVLHGRPTLVFDYNGDPHAQAHSLGDEIMRQLAGTLWVDERDDAIVRLNGTLQENFHVGGGLLVNIRKGSWFNFTQSLVNSEIWFPSEFTAHVDGRFLLLKGFNGDARQTYSDYRKFTTSVTILPDTQVLEDIDAPAPKPSTQPAPPAAPPTPKSDGLKSSQD